jgi:hypothetical protein
MFPILDASCNVAEGHETDAHVVCFLICHLESNTLTDITKVLVCTRRKCWDHYLNLPDNFAPEQELEFMTTIFVDCWINSKHMSNTVKKMLIYTPALLLATFLLYASHRLYSHTVISGWLTNLSASLLMIPLAILTFDAVRNKLESKLKQELFDYVKKDVDTDILTSLAHINRLFHLDVSSRESFLRILTFDRDKVNQALETPSVLGFQIYKNWGETRNLFQGVLRNPLALQVFDKKQITILIRLLKAITNFERTLFNPDTVVIIGSAEEQYKCVSGAEISKYNTSYPNRHVLLRSTNTHGQFVAVDSGDFDPGYLDNVLNTYKFSDAGKTELSTNIYNIIHFVKDWVDSTGKPLIIDPRMFRVIRRTQNEPDLDSSI